jgi:hypothetical protein
MREPTVFANDWKCGETLKPVTSSGKVVDEVHACRVQKKHKRSLSVAIRERNYEYRYFEKRRSNNCTSLTRLRKRQGMEGMSHGEIPEFNVIKPQPGKQAYARVSAGM